VRTKALGLLMRNCASISVLFISSFVLTACAENVDDTQTDTTYITHVTDVTPLDQQVDVGLNESVSAIFDVDMLPDTITSSNFTLHDGNNYFAGAVTYDGISRTATFTPDTTYSLQTTYTATLNNKILTNMDETISSYNWSFTTLDGVWGTAGPLVNYDYNYAFNLSLVIDKEENVFAVWPYTIDTYRNIYSTHYNSASDWSTAEPIMNNCIANTNASIGVDGQSIVHVIGQHAIDQTICTNRYTPGVGWGTSELLVSGNSETSDSNKPKLAVSVNGNAILGWTKNVSGLNAWVNYYTPDSGWGPAVWMENTDSSYGPQVAIDSEGNAIAVWGQYDSSIMVKYYSVVDDWSTTSDIRTEISSTSNPQVQFIAPGEVIVTWKQYIAYFNRVVVRRFSEETGWSEIQILDVDNDGVTNEPVALFSDHQGNAMVAWVDQYSNDIADSSYSDITVRKYSSLAGWGNSTIVESRCYSCNSIQGAFDSHGNAILAWIKKDLNNFDNLWAARYRHNTGWGNTQMIDTDPGSNSSDPVVAIGPNGRATAVWQKTWGSYDIWVNQFE